MARESGNMEAILGIGANANAAEMQALVSQKMADTQAANQTATLNSTERTRINQSIQARLDKNKAGADKFDMVKLGLDSQAKNSIYLGIKELNKLRYNYNYNTAMLDYIRDNPDMTNIYSYIDAVTNNKQYKEEK